ncbi:transcription/translation regulatory transformer protein RfaH [Vibrio crassostreae]|uniref:transcription/translation regulatory transformer protein RfaH n=1 Tax=Vibrio crassostreae TaxID=246167 RepID=UPI00200B51C5|nr:transcription/translation regulatory transformer protein RfaH [Vibrio crassostreae]UPR28742.1 transcription/translation regulatory transformer protein RfaH [Vibrio crassostreae]
MKTWYLLYCKRNEQTRAEVHLQNQGVDCYYPTLRVNKIRNGKREQITEPLFPSYIFIQFDYEIGPSFTSIRSTRGVVDFVRKRNVPIEVKASLIRSLKKLTINTNVEQRAPQLGDAIKIKQGQFSGVEAVFYESDGDTRSIMLINLINTQTKVSIENKDLDLP